MAVPKVDDDVCSASSCGVEEEICEVLSAMLEGNPDRRLQANQVLCLPFFSQSDVKLGRELSELYDREVQRRGRMLQCCICLESTHEVYGIECPGGVDDHFLCRDCLSSKLLSDCNTAGEGHQLTRLDGKVYCPYSTIR